MIQVSDLSKNYDQISVLKKISFKLEDKESLVILGSSGSGKTTLLRLLAGFEKLDGGTIEIDSKTMSSSTIHKAPNLRNMSMIFQDLALWPHMSLFENVNFALQHLAFSKNERTERVNEILSQVSLSDKTERFPHQLSGGEKQRLAIARAIGPLPQYILMDEPFNNLDVFLKKEMMDLIIKLTNKRDMAILYVTHNFDEVLHLADRVVVVNQGNLGKSLARKELEQLTETELINWYAECLIT